MNKFILAILAVAVLVAAGMAGLFSIKLNTNQNYTAVSASQACVESGAPITTETVSYNNVQYDLIKKDAQVVEQAKFSEMTSLGNDLYSLTGSNYFGTGSSTDVIYKLTNPPPKSPYNFDIYLKDGVAIPDYIKNCKSTGGQVMIVMGDTTAFPPYSINASEIPGFSDPGVLSFIYNGSSVSFDSIKSLVGIRLLGNVSTTKGSLPLYFHNGTGYLIDGATAYAYLPSANPVPTIPADQRSLQLKRVIPVTTNSYSWWTPSCKPAIYLYPQKEEAVNVKVNTRGKFTLTIPAYQANGWDVVAEPSGTVKTQTGNYPYLYYESVVPDSLVQKPESGFVVKQSELPQLFETILPKLGLNSTEAKGFKDYWEKVLPSSDYYFVGIMQKKQTDAIEPLELTPKPDTLIRVRLYFEALKTKTVVKEPVIETPERNGFTVVEWGGMVKTDKENPFTCSQ